MCQPREYIQAPRSNAPGSLVGDRSKEGVD
jgi:hypothetical protein